MKDKKYIFFKSRNPGETVRIEKTESELTKIDRDLIYGNLINVWNNTPSDIQIKFIKKVIYSTK